MPKNAKKPQIRFKGFTDAWEQRKLGEIANKVLDKNIGLQYVETLTNSAEYGIISQREFFDHNISKIESLEGYYIVQNNDFVYNPRISTTAPVGPINRNKLGRSGVMSPLYTVFRVENVDFTFLEYFFKTNCWHAFMNYNGDSGARSDRFSIKDNIFFEMPIVIPRIEEQIKIGKYMLKLDNLITLHQRKLDKLKNIKKSMLEKMFPKNGSNIPEIRFKGFTDAWEQRKLGDVGEIITGSTPSTLHPEYYSEEGLPWVTPTDINQNIIFNTDKKLSIYGEKVSRIVPPGSILVTCIASIGKNAMLTTAGSFNQQINGLIPNFKNYNSYFLLTASFLWSAKMIKEAAAGTMQIVNKNEFTNINTYIPTLKEQKIIGAYFNNLDNLITLHQRKLEKLQNIKKACLEKMFV